MKRRNTMEYRYKTTINTYDEDFDKLSLDYNADMYYGGVLPLSDTMVDNMDKEKIMNILSTSSHGVAVDLGFRYRINKWVEVEASLLDLGFIHWNNAQNLKINPTHVDFEGVDLTTAEKRDNWTQVFEDMADTMKNSVENVTPQTIPAFNKMLITKLNIGAYLWLSKNDRFGFTFNGRMYGGKFIPAGSISYHRNLGRFFDFTVGNTFKSKSLLNPGLGLNLKLGVFNLYALVDYTNHIFYVDKLKNVNVVVGINFVSGRFNHIKGKKIANTAPSYSVNF